MSTITETEPNYEEMRSQATTVAARSSLALSVISFGIVMAICYYAGSVIQTILVSLILAIFLEPIVSLLSRIHIPRAVGALLAVSILAALMVLTSLYLYNRVEVFAQEIPRYSAVIRQAARNVQRRIERIRKQTEQVIPPSTEPVQSVTVADASLFSRYLFPGVRTAASVLMTVGFIPFLVFFFLTGKDHLIKSTIGFFSDGDRASIQKGLSDIAAMMRGYLVGNIFVGLITSTATIVLLVAYEFPFPIIMGFVSGFLTLVPYLGLPLAILPPLVMALPYFHTMKPYLVVTSFLVAFHLIGLNLLFPKIVGKRVNLNPVAVTLALLVWGWLWGAMGLLLAIPITAGAKAVCDSVERLHKVGRFLGE